jgi:GLPGLI family protein
VQLCTQHLFYNKYFINNMRKGISLILFILPLTLFCQTIDSVVVKCAYTLTVTPDTTLIANKAKDIMILEMGDNGSKYYSYFRNLGDSLLNADVANGGNLGEMMMNSTKYHKDKASIVIYKNYTTAEITITEEVGQEYIYKEALSAQDWEILPDTTTILGFNCQKATAHFRGRIYFAWFAKDIAIPNGPWKFYGLPGLIMQVFDSQNYFDFTCTGVEKAYNRNLSLKNSKDYIKISRNEIMDLKRQRAEDPISFSENYSGGVSVKINVPIEQRKNYKKPFNPMERSND